MKHLLIITILILALPTIALLCPLSWLRQTEHAGEHKPVCALPPPTHNPNWIEIDGNLAPISQPATDLQRIAKCEAQETLKRAQNELTFHMMQCPWDNPYKDGWFNPSYANTEYRKELVKRIDKAQERLNALYHQMPNQEPNTHAHVAQDPVNASTP